MKRCSLVATMFVLAFSTFALAADTQKLLVGKWQAVKADEGTLPVGTIVEFLADGKMKVTPPMTEAKDKKEAPPPLEGSYTLKGDSFTYKLNLGGKDLTAKINIKKISETELDTMNDETKKSVSFKKVK